MAMQTQHQEQLVFHLTGKRQGDSLSGIEGLDLRHGLGEPAGVADLHADLHDEVPPTTWYSSVHSLRSASCDRSSEPMSAPFSKYTR